MQTQARSKPATTIVIGDRLGGGVTKQHPVSGPSLEDMLPYAPRVDRADFTAYTVQDTCPQQRINY